MKVSKQALLGTGVLLGGSVLLYATVHQVLTTSQTKKDVDNGALVASDSGADNASTNNRTPLTADVQTEKNLLAAKQREREARVQQQELAAQQYMTEQQRIEAEALAKSRAENQQYLNPRVSVASSVTVTPITQPVVTPRPVEVLTPAPSTAPTAAPKPPVLKQEVPKQEVPKPQVSTSQVSRPSVAQTPETVAKKPPVDSTPKPAAKPVTPAANAAQGNKAAEDKRTVAQATPKPITATTPAAPANPSSYQVKTGEGLIGLSRRYNIPVSALAAANNLDTNASLRVGQALTIPSAGQVQRLQQQAAQEAQKKQQHQAAQQKLQQARQQAKQTDAKGTFGVQVALATDQQKADEIAKQLKAAGYQVKTSQTSRGVRVVVGPETGKVAALALKDKVNSDPRVKAGNAWVLYW